MPELQVVGENPKPRRRVIRFRHLRYAGFSGEAWKRRTVFIVGAVAVGLIAVSFAKCADAAQEAYRNWLTAFHWSPLLVTPLGFALLAFVTRRWFPAAPGSGIPQVIAARRHRDHEYRQSLLGFKTMLGKIVLTSVAMLLGASVGREGPTVQVGASTMFAVAGLAGIGRHEGLVLAGAAAGIAAAFNAPLAGILFAIEELAKAFLGRINDLVILAVVISGAVSWMVVGNYPYFGEVSVKVLHAHDLLAVPCCALLGGLLGGLFSKMMTVIMRRPPSFIRAWRRSPYLFAAGCGLLVAVLSIASSGYASGSAYSETRAGLEQGILLPWWYGFAKLFSTLASAVSGIPGGLFSPSLAVGAGMGSMIAHVIPSLNPRDLMLLMMAGYFSGVVQSPLTATVIVMEMTSEREMVILLMATAMVAAGISRLVNREPLYHALSHGFAPQAFKHSAGK